MLKEIVHPRFPLLLLDSNEIFLNININNEHRPNPVKGIDILISK